ncbi:ATP-binding cassette domain-containing protein [Streptomyces sp. GC420]|uniref:ATP-binding cassette domain-containing protein n=1 Tax=Streptomyces sp. GC420 TaxID=2697568 RepID=UPI001414D7D6|nr:ATP-binding cassette domain-containing protein [Streptomyces sp. GC420]NBM18175.1 ATP-binding cassette domain-containing protein [Streptomyces sp. GC420]
MESDPQGAGISARGLGLRGPRGWAFRDIGFEAAPGALIAVEGQSGSGRTCLLLALTGRMRPTEGSAETGGLRLPKHMAAVRRISGLAHVPGVTDLEPSLSVAEHLRERALLQRRFGGPVRSLFRSREERFAQTRERVGTALTTAGLDVGSLPKGSRTRVHDLERLESLRLSVALALIGSPRLLAVDDLDLKLSDAEREAAWDMLRSVTAGGTTVLAVCSEAAEDALRVRPAPSPAAEETENTDACGTGPTGPDGTEAGTGDTGTADTDSGADRAHTDNRADRAEATTKGRAENALAEAGRA